MRLVAAAALLCPGSKAGVRARGGTLARRTGGGQGIRPVRVEEGER